MNYYFFLLFLFLPIGSLTAQINNARETSFKAPDSVASLYSGASLDNLPLLAYNLTAQFSEDVEKLRAIYTWVSTNIENDYTLYALNKRKREKFGNDPLKLEEWNDQLTNEVFSTLLKEKKTVCTGYAYLIKELCYHAGIEAEIIDGYGRSADSNIGGKGIVNHSWNAVNLSGQWYLCDATWSSGTVNPQEKMFVQRYADGYFLADPELFALNHYPEDSGWLLLKNKPLLKDFLNGPLVYRGAFEHYVMPVSPQLFVVNLRKGNDFSIIYEKLNNNPLDEIYLEVLRGDRIVKKSVTPIELTNNQFQINYSFTSKGKYLVHLLINADYVMTHEVNVQK